jgi:hypothetical protein
MVGIGARRYVRRGARAAALGLLALAPLACMRPMGLIYSDVTMPFDLNLNATPIGSKTASMDVNMVKYPVNESLQIDWASNAYGDIMTKYKIQKGYFADKRSLSILLGIFGQETVIVSGD